MRMAKRKAQERDGLGELFFSVGTVTKSADPELRKRILALRE